MNKFPLVTGIPLLLVNLIPLAGVVFLGWNLFEVLYAYWLESAVIGFYSLIRIIISYNILSILIAPFFMAHFGGFMYGHLFFLVRVFGGQEVSRQRIVWDMIWSFNANFSAILAALFVSHGISFIYHFLVKKEFLRERRDFMTGPYKRIILMHLTIIFGGWLVLIFKEPVWGLAVLVVLKSIMDLRGHKREHGYT